MCCSINSYDDVDCGPADPIPSFRPKLVPGLQLHDVITREDRSKFVSEISFFKLFFTHELIDMICMYTNKYAKFVAPQHPVLSMGWIDVTREEMYRYIGLLFYMSVADYPALYLYWSTATLFHGTWARAFISSRRRFQQISSFLKVSNFENEKKDDKLCKVRFLHDYIRRKCMKLYQPDVNVSIDERMVQNKGRYSFRQYIKDKPTKWGIKIWVIADSATGYTYNFDVYTGKRDKTAKTSFGLAYDVVFRLMSTLFGQGYKLFVDNFYSSVQLCKDLLKHQTTLCGTILTNRRGIPKSFKSKKKLEERGAGQWIRDGNVVFLQWQDNKKVTFITSMSKNASKFQYCKRRTKVKGEFRTLFVRQPTVVSEYNQFMSDVDKSDQLIGKYNSLRRTNRFWKTLFYHFLDIAKVNAYILFQEWRKLNPDIAELQRPARYGQLEFTVELMKQLANLSDSERIPTYEVHTNNNGHPVKPKWSTKANNCKRCYRLLKKEVKTSVKCETCNTHLCFNSKRECLNLEHMSD